MAAPPTSLPAREPPTVKADPLVAPPSSLLDPAKPERKTAELPQK